MKKLINGSIRLYQKLISPSIKIVLPAASCHYYPSCSQYALEAVEKYGPSRGLALFVKRFINCHPFAEGGFDPVR